MFTGIIESTGIIKNKSVNGTNIIFTINADNFAQKLGESISINGACLTVIKFSAESFNVEAIPETLKLTNLGDLEIHDQVNLEKSLTVGSSLDGHFVLGHIDFKTTVKKISLDGDSTRISFNSPKDYQKYIAKKGSICINGVSLTISETTEQDFEVCLIPYTLSHTNLGHLQIGSYVNIEIDIIARYLEKQLNFLPHEN